MKIEKPLASYIDHTILRPNCNKEDIKQLCIEAKEYGFASVCVPPYFVQYAKRQLNDTPISVATIVGFPMGYTTTSAKVEEIKRAINDGADELDVVVNIAAIKSGDWSYVENDLDTMTRLTAMRSKLIKVIFEVELLELDEIQRLCEICVEKEVDYVKTSTGVNGKGNQPEIIRLLRDNLPSNIKIKAAGGIRLQEEAVALIQAGADRLGCSKSTGVVTY